MGSDFMPSTSPMNSFSAGPVASARTELPATTEPTPLRPLAPAKAP